MANKSMHAPNRQSPGSARGLLGLGAAGLALLAGCASPLESKRDQDLRRSVRESATRELAEAQENSEPVKLFRENRIEQLRIKPEVLQQLDTIGGPKSYGNTTLPTGRNLYGRPVRTARVTMERAIQSAVQRNLNVEFARLGPAINQQQVIAAEAAFDWVFFTNAQYQSTDQPRTSTVFSSVTTDQREVTDATAGFRKPLIAGGQLSLQSQFTNTANKTNNLNTIPNPSREANFVIQLDQPLLRNFGSDVALAQVRLSRNAELDQISELKGTLLTNVNNTEEAYWSLVQAESDLRILQRLLERGEEVLKLLRDRAEFDAKPANLSNAAATVESRRADVIRAQRVLRDRSERLKVLINDPEFPVGSELLLLGSDLPTEQPMEFSLVDCVNAALASRPEVQRAILSIDNTSIRQTVADNARLPRLDLRALTRFSGLGRGIADPYEQIEEARFVDYQIGVSFEQPIGNRAAEANYRQRRLERMQATIAYSNTVQGIVNDLKTALYDVVTNYTLIEQTKAARIAAAEDLRTLLIEQEVLTGLTPEQLNLRLQRQELLARSEQQETEAMLNYNTALARLYTSMGTGLERNRIRFGAPPVKLESRTSELFPDYPLEPRRKAIEDIRRE